MKIREFACIALLVISSFAANSVTPSRAELELMYDKAFLAFDESNHTEALKNLDAIDALQPDLAESQNLRGVIMMRQKDYPAAETALKKALAADPKFWNARFNLAEIPFLQKNWSEARKRFQELLTGNVSELAGEATQLIQYKIFLTYLLEGKENMADSLMAKFELAPEEPALHYARVAVALNKNDDGGANEWLAKAEKSFSPQLNKRFAESLYEVGWREKPAGQTRAAVELNSAADRAAQTKAFGEAKFKEAEQALAQRDLTAARKFVDEADGAAPNDPRLPNLRGEILLEQKEYDQAEEEFRKALEADPNSREAQFNLAQVPFKKKEYAKARDRFESLFSVTTGADKDQAAQLIKFKIFLTLLLEGKDARAQKMMEQFQFTGDTPALYYAQAATEFKNNNTIKANEWVTSARKIYSPALNSVFSEAFFDIGWLQNAAIAASPAPSVAEPDQPEPAPSIEPTPLPVVALTQNTLPITSDPLALEADSAVPGMEATTASPSSAASTTLPSPSSDAFTEASPTVETPVASTASPAAASPVVASAPDTEGAVANETSTEVPATVLAPAQVGEWSQPTFADRLRERNTLFVAALLMAGILLLGGVVIAEFRRHAARTSASRRVSPAEAPVSASKDSAGSIDDLAPARLPGGPPQASLQLRASEPALHRRNLAVVRLARSSDSRPAVAAPDPDVVKAETNAAPSTEGSDEELAETAAEAFSEPVGEPIAEGDTVEAFAPATAEAPQTDEILSDGFAPPSEAEAELMPFAEPSGENVPGLGSPAVQPSPAEASIEAWPPDAVESFSAIEEDAERNGQRQSMPSRIPALENEEPVANISAVAAESSRAEMTGSAAASLAGSEALRDSVATSPSSPRTTINEPTDQQPTTLAIMPSTTTPTAAPVIAAAAPTGMPQPAVAMQLAPQSPGGTMQAAVQITFSFEIASLQLTETFKMGAMLLKPTSKVVTMRLAPSQHPQPAMNLQVTFEIASVQLDGNALGVVQLTPSEQQRPSITSSPSFSVTGLQLVSGAESASVQLTPSEQGQASVLVTAPFQIATVEFSPSFEIASIILNSTSSNVNVQLPGTGPSAVEGAPLFAIGDVQLSENGEIGMMQLNPTEANRA